MTSGPEGPDIRAYLQTRTASPCGFSPDSQTILVNSDVPGSAQLFGLDAVAVREGGVPVEKLTQLTALPEPVGGGYLPVPVDGHDALLLGVDAGGNEKHQLYLLDLAPAAGTGAAVPPPVTSTDALTPLVVDPEHIHRAGGMTRDGVLLAYSTNRRTGSDFDVWVREMATGEEQLVHAPGGWTWAGGFSPDGRVLAVGALTEQAADSTAAPLRPRDRDAHRARAARRARRDRLAVLAAGLVRLLLLPRRRPRRRRDRPRDRRRRRGSSCSSRAGTRAAPSTGRGGTCSSSPTPTAPPPRPCTTRRPSR